MRNGLLSALVTLIAIGLVTASAALADSVADSIDVPEPGTLALLATGATALAGLGWFRHRK